MVKNMLTGTLALAATGTRAQSIAQPAAITTASIFLCTSTPAIRYGIGVSSAGAERVPDSSLFRVSGSRHVHRGLDDAHLFAQPHTRRISQFIGLDFSTGSSISPLRAAAILPKIFMEFRELRERGHPSLLCRGRAEITSPARGASALHASSARPEYVVERPIL